MAASCVGPLVVGVTAEGAGAEARPRRAGTRSVLTSERTGGSYDWFAPLLSSRRFLLQAHLPKDGPQREIIGGFECPRQDEGQSDDEQWALEEQAGEDRAAGRAQAASQRGEARSRGAFFRIHQRHRVRLPGGHIHLRKR